MASRSILRRVRPDRPPMQLYRLAVPYRSTVPYTLQNRRNCSSRTSPPSNLPNQNLDMSNPLYRDLIKSIKNPFIRDSIHRLVQGSTTFSESLSQDLHAGTGGSLYFRIPELPPKMKGHDHDPDGIPLPPNTFRVSSAEELRGILGRILEYRASLLEKHEDVREWNESTNAGDGSGVAAATEKTSRREEEKVEREEARKEDTPPAEPKTSQSSPQPESKSAEMPDWKPSESLDAFKERFNQYVKTGNQFVKGKIPGVSMSSVLETLEQQIRKSREALEQGKSITLDNETRKRLLQEDRLHNLGFERTKEMKSHREFLEAVSEARKKKKLEAAERLKREESKMHEDPAKPPKTESTVSASEPKRPRFISHSEMKSLSKVCIPQATSTEADPKNPQLDDPFLPYEKDIREVKKILVNLLSSLPKDSTPQPAAPPEQENKTPEIKGEDSGTDTVEPATERITLMDILNGTASSKSENPEQKPEAPPASSPLPEKTKTSESVVDSPSPPPNTNTPPESTAGLLEAIAALSEKLSQANKRISELENPSSNLPKFEKFTDHMDGALATQYSDLRDYFEEGVLSETRDVAARVGSLEKTMQKILENQKAAATAQSKDGACIYSTEGESGAGPNIPVTVKLDEVDKTSIQEAVDAAIDKAVDKILVGVQKDREGELDDLVESIVERLENFQDYELVETVTREVLNSNEVSKRLDLHVKIIVGQVLEELGKDENGDLQRIIDAAVKAGTRDIEETVKSRLGDVQLKLFGMERALRGM
ncbi:hypothetical protein TWF481_006968 [Arthrobotrys musiformis]|uniref:Uncharacterized protein n=1 Tax=Arthrobotrys musiformis TaxID=47236 RepID=A0AAV9WA34_9PEZI